jgi:hypothetical protein
MPTSRGSKLWHFIGELLHIHHLLELFGLWGLIVGPVGGIGVAFLAGVEGLPLAIQIVLGLATLLLLLSLSKGFKPRVEHTSTSSPEGTTQRTTATGKSNQAFSAGRDIYVGNQPPTETIQKQKPGANNHVKPNLRYAGYRNLGVYIDSYSRGGVKEPTNAEENQNSYQAVVLRFENEPWSDGVGANTGDLIAKAEYDSTPQPSRISYGVWIDASIRSHYIDVGETHELLLFIKNASKNELSVLDDKRELNSHFADPWSWFRIEDADKIRSVRITLTDQRSLTQYIFDFDVTESSDGFVVHLKGSKLPPPHRESPTAPAHE